MAFFSSGLSRSLLSLASADQASAKLSQQLITGKKIQAAKDDPSTWLTADRAESAAGLLDVIHTGLTEVTTNLGVVDTTMKTIGQDLTTAASQLRQAQGYPAGNPSRTQYITNFNNLLQQIDTLVNTTEEPAARNLMTDPAANPQGGDIRVLVGPDGQLRTVHAQEIDTGPQGLNVWALNPALATDAEIQAALQNLGTAQTTLASRRAAMGADASDISRYQTQLSQVSDLYQSAADSLTAADATEAALNLQSVQTQHSLAVQTLASIGTDRNAVLGLLR